MEGKDVLFIPSLVQDGADTVYPFIDFPVFGPVPPTICNAPKAILAYIKPRVDTWIYGLVGGSRG